MECHTSENSKDMIVKMCTSKDIASVEAAADPVGGGVEGGGHGPSSPVSRSLHCSVPVFGNVTDINNIGYKVIYIDRCVLST